MNKNTKFKVEFKHKKNHCKQELTASCRNEVAMWIILPFCSLFACKLRLVKTKHSFFFRKSWINFVRLLCINSKNLRHELLLNLWRERNKNKTEIFFFAKLASRVEHDKCLLLELMSCATIKEHQTTGFGNKNLLELFFFN